MGRVYPVSPLFTPSLSNLGVLAHEAGDLERAGRLLEESVAVKRRLGNRHGLANSLESLGNLERSRRNRARALALCREALEIRRELGHRQGIAMSLNNLGYLLLEEGDPVGARSHLMECLALFAELDQPRGLLESLTGLAGVFAASGDLQQAARLLGASAAGREARGFVITACEQGAIRRCRVALSSAPGEEGFAALEQAGRALSLQEALAEARSGEPAQVQAPVNQVDRR